MNNDKIYNRPQVIERPFRSNITTDYPLNSESGQHDFFPCNIGAL